MKKSKTEKAITSLVESMSDEMLDGISLEHAERLVTEVIRHGEEAWKIFNETLENNCSVKFAHMCATRKPPGTQGTDRNFMEGQQSGSWLDRMGSRWRNSVLAKAKAAGISIAGKVWKGSLGPASDPRAWVSDLHDVKKACEAKGLHCEGAVKVDQPEREPPKPKKLAESLVREMMGKRLAADPGLAEKVKKNKKAARALREEVIHKHGHPRIKE